MIAQENFIYRCAACPYYTHSAFNLQKVTCQTCPEPEKNYNYICPKCKAPLFKIKRKT